MVANLVMGCASQVTKQGAAVAQETESSSPLTGTDLPKPANPGTASFLSSQQEYSYKYLVAEVASQRGQYGLAAKYFFEMAEPLRDAHLAERATRTALYAKDDALAVKAARLWVTLEPQNPNARQILGEILFRLGNHGEAETQLEIMFDNLQGDSSQQRLDVIALFLEKQPDQQRALELMENLLKKRQKNPLALLTYTRLLVHVKQFAKAQSVLEQLFQLAPDHEQGIPLYAHVLNEQNKTDQALQWLKQALQKRPDKHQWRLVYARLLTATEQFDKAIQQFQLLLAKSPNPAEMLYTLGILSLRTERLSAAKHYFTELVKTGEQQDAAYYYLGQIDETEKKLSDALSWYKKVKEGNNYLNAQARIALILVEQGRLEKALEHLRAVPVENDQDALTLVQFEAELLMDQKRYDQAMETYSRALEKDPNNTALLYMRALLAEQMGLIDLLERDLRHVLTIEPNNPQAINALGYSLANLTDRYEEALELIKRAEELRPDDYYVLDSLGWVLYKMGNYPEALIYLRKALAKQNDSEVATHLGEVLWVTGNQEEAKQVWNKATEDFPKDEQLEEVMKRFIP